jgi:hypothetical protein
MKLKIRKWDIANHLSKKPGSIILLLGKRGTGKSVMMVDIAKTLQDTGVIDMAIGMSPTDESNGTLSQFLPKTLIYPDFNENIVERILQQQKKQIKEGKECKRVFIFMDDCGYDSKAIFNSKVMKRLFYNGRHSKIGLCLALQYAIDMPVAFRANCDVCITMRETIYSNRERLYKQYFGQFENMKAFCMTMDACTENYSALVSANNITNSNNISDSVFWYRAGVHEDPFVLGSKAVRTLDRRCFDDVETRLEEEKNKKESDRNSAINRVVRGDENGNSIYKR